MSEPELWIARDPNGELFIYIGEPKISGTAYFNSLDDWEQLPSSWLPQIQPGQKARVRLVVEEPPHDRR